MSMFLLLVINGKIGYMERLDKLPIVLIAALFCSFIPLKLVACVYGLFILLHMYALAPECALVMAVVMFLMMVIYIRFVPNETLVILLTSIAYMLKIPYVMPLAMGLVGTPVSAISVSFGLCLGYLIQYISVNSSTILTVDDGQMVSRIIFMINGLVSNKPMIIMTVVFIITLIMVYVIRRLSVDYSWVIAIIAGGIVDTILLLMCEMILNPGFSVVGILLGNIVAIAIAFVVLFFDFHLDYKKTETLQFEDEEYYYYVKAVPKISVSSSNKKVKRINSSYPTEYVKGSNAGRSSGYTVKKDR
jgi:hypothetical protein